MLIILFLNVTYYERVMDKILLEYLEAEPFLPIKVLPNLLSLFHHMYTVECENPEIYCNILHPN